MLGIFFDVAAELYLAVPPVDINLTDQVGESTAPSANLFSRDASEGEKEIHNRCSPQQSTVHFLTYDFVPSRNLRRQGIICSEIKSSDLIVSTDIIIRQHRFII